MTKNFAQSLSESCALINVHLTRWAGTVTRKDIADNVAVQIGAKKDSGKYVLNLVPKSLAPSHDAIRKLDGQIRNQIVLPWSTPTQTKGVRLVTTAVAEKLQEMLSEKQAERQALVERFLNDEYSKVQARAKDFLGSAYRAIDYPHPMAIQSRYAFEARFTSLAPTNPSILGMPAQIMQSIEQEMLKEQDVLRNLASEQVMTKLDEQITHCITSLEGYSTQLSVVDGVAKETVTGSVFRDSLMGNLYDRAQQAKLMDIGVARHAASIGSDVLDAISHGKITMDSQQLRGSPIDRQVTIDKLKEIRATYNMPEPDEQHAYQSASEEYLVDDGWEF